MNWDQLRSYMLMWIILSKFQRATAINDTWSQHCNYFYFVANQTRDGINLPIVTYEGDDAYNVGLHESVLPVYSIILSKKWN